MSRLNEAVRLATIGLVVVIVLASPARAQEIEVTPTLGVLGGGTFEVEDGELSIDTAPRFGVVVDVPVRDDLQFELRYGRQESEMRFRAVTFGRSAELFDIAVQHFHGGLLWEILGGRMRPFLSFTVGASHFAPEPQDVASEWRFSAGLGGGLKAFLSDHVGIRLEARALPTLEESGDELVFCAEPVGRCFLSISERSFLYQGTASAGLILSF